MKRMMSLNVNKSLNIIIIGPPGKPKIDIELYSDNNLPLSIIGGGKGTISKKLVKDFQFSHVSMGDLLR